MKKKLSPFSPDQKTTPSVLSNVLTNVLTIAGADISAGAGIQADLATFHAHKLHGLTAITCVVAETDRTRGTIHPVPPAHLAEQLELLFQHYSITAIKTGMLFSAEHIQVIASFAQEIKKIPLIIDPVLSASTGDTLHKGEEFLPTMIEKLFPLATLITPNREEAEKILGKLLAPEDDPALHARTLAQHISAPILLKGGHYAGANAHDVLAFPNGETQTFSAPRLVIDAPTLRGTGCRLSSAITANLALGSPLNTSIQSAKAFLWKKIQSLAF